jgi:serine/threonine protein phosphatase PrpC
MVESFCLGIRLCFNLEDEDDTDIGMLDMDNDPGSSSGCTAVVTLLRDKQLLVANAGDSRCVVCRAGRAIEMSIGSYDQPFSHQ